MKEEILNELKNISAKADDLCEHVFDLKIAIFGNWHKVADGDLPKENCYVLAFIDDGDATYYDVLNCDDGDFFRYEKEQYGVTAWMELPKYKE